MTKQNKIKFLATLLAITQSITLSGCKTTPRIVVDDSDNAVNYVREFEEVFRKEKEKWENDVVVYKVKTTYVKPVIIHNSDGTTTYTAPQGCMISGSGEDLKCFYNTYIKSSDEEHSADLSKTISYTSYSDENGVHEVLEVEPLVIYVTREVTSEKLVDGKKEFVTTYYEMPVYTAPNNATRVEGSGPDMKCYIDYFHTIIDDLDLNEEKDEGLKLSK